MDKSQQKNNTSQSFISSTQPNIFLRILKKIDIFAFIPVPKDDSVSTKQSLIGTAIFFTIILTYIIYDFVQFVQSNPPIQQSYRTPLDEDIYMLPRVSLAFMEDNKTQSYQKLFKFEFQKYTKAIGIDKYVPIQYKFVKYQNGNKSNFQYIDWMNDQTKQYYYVLRTPVEPLYAQGLLYSSNVNKYVRIKMSYCWDNTTNSTCSSQSQINLKSNFGRFFLFIQNKHDESSISLQKKAANGNDFILYNFYVIPNFYKRININFQVVKTVILPDYFWRWSNQQNTRLQIDSVFQEMSQVNFQHPNNTDAIAFNLQLSPMIVNNRISFETLIDHISLWGAFWGVLFAIFAIFFLSYNKKKFYKKNPDWSKFKKIGGSNLEEDDQ